MINVLYSFERGSDLEYNLVLRHSIGHFRVAFTSVSKRVLVYNLSYGIEIFLHVHCLANQTYLLMKGCSPELVLEQKEK